MGTTWSARIALPKGRAPGDISAGIAARLDRVIAQMSNWEPESDISRFNCSPIGEWQALPDDMLTVLRTGLDIAARSTGAFDPALEQAVIHWGFGPRAPDNASARPSSAPNWRAIECREQHGRRTGDVGLDFSGIAKGFGVDAVSDWLTGEGLPNHLVEIGGELRGHGVRPDGQPWWVDLEAPPGMALPVTRVALSGLSVATSGDYRRYHERDGQRYAHSIDPRTGAPVDNGVASVSVLHASAMEADAWATGLLVLGIEQGLALAAREELATLMVRREANGPVEYMSPALAAMLD